MAKPILCIDFDGVIHSYTSGWKGPLTIADPVTPGFFEWAVEAAEHFKLVVYSSRTKEPGSVDAMRTWLKAQFFKWGDEQLKANKRTAASLEDIEFAHEKPAAFLTVDDRAVLFRGSWSDPELAPETLRAFQPWNKKG